MSFIRLAFTSNGHRPLSELAPGDRGVVVDMKMAGDGRTDRLLALGVTPGAVVVVLQTFPGVVFLCDQTELAVERAVAEAIVVRQAQ
jgi:Fe2+ transport system protein FeoA